MATFSVQPSPPLAADGPALSRVLQQAGVSKSAFVRVAGEAGLAAMLWMNRHGFANASYAQASRVAAMAPVEALLIPHPCGVEELAAILGDGSCLNAGGALIVQIASVRTAAISDSVSALLAVRGYAIEHRVAEKGRHVCIARREGRGGFSRAA